MVTSRNHSAPRLLTLCERTVGALGLAGLAAVVVLAALPLLRGTRIHNGIWALPILASLVAVLSSALAFSAGGFDRLQRRWLGSAAPVTVRDRWLTLAGAGLLLCASAGLMAMFQSAASPTDPSDGAFAGTAP